MSNDKTGGEAFPRPYPGSGGMTMREYYAGKALQGFCANPAVFAENGRTGWGLVNATESQLADYCFKLADDMIEATTAAQAATDKSED